MSQQSPFFGSDAALGRYYPLTDVEHLALTRDASRCLTHGLCKSRPQIDGRIPLPRGKDRVHGATHRSIENQSQPSAVDDAHRIIEPARRCRLEYDSASLYLARPDVHYSAMVVPEECRQAIREEIPSRSDCRPHFVPSTAWLRELRSKSRSFRCLHCVQYVHA